MIKKFFYYGGRFVLAPLAMILLVTLGFPAPIWPAILLIIAIVVLMAIYPSPKIERLVASITIFTLCFVLIGFTLGNWGFKKFKQNFPIMAETFPRALLGVDLRGAAKEDPAMVEAKLKLLIMQREKEQELADLVEKKINEGRWEEARELIKRLEKNREENDEIIFSRQKKDSKITIAPATMQAPGITGNVFSFSIKPGEIYAIDGIEIKKGQTFTFLTYNAPIEYRVKDEESACWETVKNNLPWRALVNGTLEIKAGNMPADVTLNII